MGQREGFSLTDLQKANKLYNCAQVDDKGVLPETGGDGTEGTGGSTGGDGGDNGGGGSTVDCSDQKWSCFAWPTLGKFFKVEFFFNFNEKLTVLLD